MKRFLHFITGYSFGILSLAACASGYKYYALQMPDTCYGQGQLLGAQGSDGWPDLPLSSCQPDPAVKGKCVVELVEDHFKKEKDLEECQVALKACQGG